MAAPRYYARSLAPVMGAVIGAIAGSRAAPDAREEWILGSGAMGLVAGLVVMLLDQPATEIAIGDNSEGNSAPTPPVRQGAIVHRLLAILSIALCWTPGLGLNIAILALALNWKCRGWLRRLSLYGLLCSICFSVLWAVVIVQGNKQ
jgi:hypothetical protein